jgi:two-component system response regulator AtoC
MKRLLIVDTSLSLRESLNIILKNQYEVMTSPSLLDGLSLLRREKIDLIILGINDLPGNVRELVEELVEVKKSIPLILMGEQHLLKAYQEFLKGYISESIVLPFRIFEIREKVKKTLCGFFPPFSERSYENRLIEKYQKLYNSPLLESKMKRFIPKIMGGKSPILLWGERGSGKEMVAKIIHYLGLTNAGAFVKIDCTTLTGESLISQLKMIRPAPTDENIEVSLYWDEIGRLKPELQVTLEEILEEGVRVVSTQGSPVSPRIVASSSEDLNDITARGEFRESLLYRLNHFPLHIKSLRERIEDLPRIAQEIVNSLVAKGFSKKKQISPEAMEILKNYYWPGNLRELESVLLRSCLLSEGEMITRKDVYFTGEEITAQEKKETPFISSMVPEEAETTFEQLVSGLAHEIKNPLVAIKTFTQLLSERFDDAEFRKQFYQVVGKSIDRIEWLTKRVLDYANFLKAQLIPINFPAILDHSIIQNQEMLRTKKITVQREGLGSLSSSTVLSDPRQLSYVLENILVHICNDLPEGSEIVFSTQLSHLREHEKELFPLKDFPDYRIVELKISLPSLTHLSSTGVTISLASPHFYSLELFLSQMIVNRNLGLMEKILEEGETVLILKLPLSQFSPEEIDHEKDPRCR